jgi:hypothetical protein
VRKCFDNCEPLHLVIRAGAARNHAPDIGAILFVAPTIGFDLRDGLED